MGSILKSTLEDVYEGAMANPIIFGDFMTANPTEETHIDPKLYEDCGGYEQVKKKFDWLLQEYNYDENNIEMNLVLFDDALEHLVKVYRIIRFPLGHALLVGYGGSGKQSLTKLAAFSAKYKIFTITLTRGYKEKEFREDLRTLFGLLCEGPVLFLFTDAHVIEEGFLELVNNLLTIGMVPALFDEEEKKGMSDKIKD
jgi:dynein heavy chain